jgi:hypothetical protein
MSFDKNEKGINVIPLIEIQDKPKLFLLNASLLSEIKSNGRKGVRTTELIILSTKLI